VVAVSLHYRILLPDFLSFLEMYHMPVDEVLRELSLASEQNLEEHA
jgi:hypothetical protein